MGTEAAVLAAAVVQLILAGDGIAGWQVQATVCAGHHLLHLALLAAAWWWYILFLAAVVAPDANGNHDDQGDEQILHR